MHSAFLQNQNYLISQNTKSFYWNVEIVLLQNSMNTWGQVDEQKDRSLIRQARLGSLRELQSQTGEELDALLPSVLDRAFKGEL